MKTAIVFVLLVLCLAQTMAWNDGLWGRELRKRVKPKVDAETMKLAEEIINQQHYFGKGRKMTKLHNVEQDAEKSKQNV
jgi:hypothetical protein